MLSTGIAEWYIMAREIITRELNDWSPLNETDLFFIDLDLQNPKVNFGIQRYNEEIRTSGFVGVGRLYNRDKAVIQSNGKEHIVIISSKYCMNPWKMLEKVIKDDEYEDYLNALSKNKSLYHVFYEQPLIRLAQNEQNDSELLFALSFIYSCYILCKKGLKKTMIQREQNYRSKVKGRIDVKQNIRENTCRGHNDRFFCRYIDFTEDNTENRIIKSTLKKCKSIIEERFELNSETARRVSFCTNVLKHISDVTIKASDFNSVSVSGLYMYYKPVLQQAKSIISQKYYSYTAESGKTVMRSVYTVPYMINMETLFEFYSRTILKETINNDRYKIDRYSLKWYSAAESDKAERGIHLSPYFIPDIVIRDKVTNRPLTVIDVKYKSHSRADREDSHQLLSYVLLTGVEKCGFVFPGSETKIKTMHTSGSDNLVLNTPLAANLRYYELILGDTLSEDILDQMLH